MVVVAQKVEEHVGVDEVVVAWVVEEHDVLDYDAVKEQVVKHFMLGHLQHFDNLLSSWPSLLEIPVLGLGTFSPITFVNHQALVG